jgi:hypothetical protein
LNEQEKKILKMIHTSTHQAKHARNRSYSIGLFINNIKTKLLKTQSRECLQVDAQLLEGSHHEYRNNNIDEMLEK